MADESEVEIKVTTINYRYHARLILDGNVLDEMACEDKEDIGYICRTMMRWHDKCGGTSSYASSSRDRLSDIEKNPPRRRGKIWYRGQLENMKAKNELRKKVRNNL